MPIETIRVVRPRSAQELINIINETETEAAMPEEIEVSVEEPIIEPIADGTMFTCEHCDRGFNAEEVDSCNVQGDIWCESCFEDCSACCDDCSGQFHEDNMTWCEYHDQSFCNRCWGRNHGSNCGSDDDYSDDDELVHDSCHRPTPRFHDVGDVSEKPTYIPGQGQKLYMGFELEVESVSGSYKGGAQHAVSKANLTTGKVAYLKHDGSLSRGFEIVSHPCTLDFYMSEFPWQMVSGLKKHGFEAWGQDTCGLHIHINKGAFVSELQLWKFIYFIYKNRTELIQFAGRESVTYANFDMDRFLNGRDEWSGAPTLSGTKLSAMAKGKGRNNNRYCAVNMQNTHTIELRFFRPSLNTATVKGCLQLCDALFNYTKEVSTKGLTRSLNFLSFHQWVMVNNEKYSELIATIAKRVGSPRKDT